jgi:hypothetical protein
MCFCLNICAKGGSNNLSCVPYGHKVMFPSEFMNKTYGIGPQWRIITFKYS